MDGWTVEGDDDRMANELENSKKKQLLSGGEIVRGKGISPIDQHVDEIDYDRLYLEDTMIKKGEKSQVGEH